ncbi:cell surface glyco 1 [Fusarium longipes]|uniref:Cell surface glyco 1 n=1 Tax=Fusarium longipes TaxID=694270 RepID=A0A395SZC5_9HYPO|nr:cell surface glyco 1 [Fusarium longipes]
MHLLKSLVLGLIIERGLCQTDLASANEDSVATLADPAADTGVADVPIPEPSAPSGGDGDDDGGDEEPTGNANPEPEPSSGEDARVPVDESVSVDTPTGPSEIPDPSTDEQPDATSDAEPTDAGNEPSPTDAAPTSDDVEPSPTNDPEPTDSNGEESTATDNEPNIVPSDSSISAPEEAIPGPTGTGQGEPVSAPEASDPLPAISPTVTTDDLVTDIPDEPTANLRSEDQPSNTGAELIGPTLTGDDSDPTATGDAEPTSAASGISDNDEDGNQGTNGPESFSSEPSATENGKSQPAASSQASDEVDSPQTTSPFEKPQETEEETAYEIPVDLEEDTTLGDYAEFKEASDGDQVVLLKPPPNGKANCEIAPTGGEVDEIPAGEYIRVLLSVKVEEVDSSSSKDVATGSRLKMLVDENTVYDKELVSTGNKGDTQNIESDPFKSAKNQKIRMIQECGEKPVELTIQDANIRVARDEKSGGGGNSGGGDGKGNDSEGSGSSSDGKDKGGGGGSNGGSSGNDGGDSDSGSGSDSNSDSVTGTGVDTSPSATSVDDGQTNVGSKSPVVGDLLMYALPLLVIFIG